MKRVEFHSCSEVCRDRGRARSRFLWEAFREVIVILAVLLALQVGIVQAFSVPTGSMEGTILPGDYLLADKLTLGPRTPHWIGIPGTEIGTHVPALKLPGIRSVERGDIVVVEVPVDLRTPYVKRVVALGGDRVEIRDKQLFVNDSPYPASTHIAHRDEWTFPPGVDQAGITPGLGNRDNWGPLVVPEGEVFLLGDNRDFSFDSRWFGPVPEENIIGCARIVTLSVNRDDAGLTPWERIRLSRSGTLLR